ncbi:MAG: class I SAM-dependent methyltransferase [Nitrospirae bacterium]|nr:class I SAM-dependent methyltransferase [Nitrospirota bacterium]
MENVLKAQYERVRRFERKPFTQSIDYSFSSIIDRKRKWLKAHGRSFDISENGLGIYTDYPLEPGHIIWFNEGIEDKAGFVKYCIKSDNGYRVGVELDGKHVDIIDEATELFNKRLEEIEKKCQNKNENPQDILQAIEDAISEIRNAYIHFEEKVKDRNIIRDAQIRFREKTNHIISKSYFMNRARTWPQGYQGDYKMLEGMYRNTPLSQGLGYYLDLAFLRAPLTVAVRNRIEKLRTILKDELLIRNNPAVLNIACGSCREVFELSSEIESSSAKFTCIDLDNDALAFAANRLSYTNISPLSSKQVVLRKYNALRMFDHELNMKEFGKQDIIYSVGFFDYLETEFLIRILNSLYQLLNSGGILIAAFKDANRYIGPDYHWIVDWDGFLQRNEEEFRNILTMANIPDSAISENRDNSGLIVFYLIRK